MRQLSGPGCLVLFLCNVHAQTGLSLSDAVREAHASNPLLLAARERVRIAQGQRLQAALRPNPRLILQSENTRFWGTPALSYPRDTDNFAYLSQVFETGGKRQRRTDLADAGIHTAEVDADVAARAIAARVSLAYWSAKAAMAVRDVLGQNVRTFEQVVQYHRDRVREGAMAEVDLLRVLLERDRQTVTAQNAEQEAVQANLTLLREMGRADINAVQLTDDLSEAHADVPVPDMDSVLAARPDVKAARQTVEQARAFLRLQQSLRSPDPEVVFGYKRTAGFDTLLAGVQVFLPVLNRNQGAIAAASSAVRAAELQLAGTERQVRAEVETAVSAYLSRRRMVTETLRPMRERADEIARIATAAYREGGLDLLRLLDAERARLDTLTSWYRTLADYQTSITTLQIVTGATL